MITDCSGFVRANGLRYPLVGGTRLAIETEKTQSHEKAQKIRRVPTYPLHAVLGSEFKDSLIFPNFCSV
jgi:hypothetical protein